MKGIDLVHHEATKTNSKQDAAYIRHFHEAFKDIKTKSMQTAVYIRPFHASPKSFRSHLKPKVKNMVRTFIKFLKKCAKSYIHSNISDFEQQKVSHIVGTVEKVILKV